MVAAGRLDAGFGGRHNSGITGRHNTGNSGRHRADFTPVSFYWQTVVYLDICSHK